LSFEKCKLAQQSENVLSRLHHELGLGITAVAYGNMDLSFEMLVTVKQENGEEGIEGVKIRLVSSSNRMSSIFWFSPPLLSSTGCY
jgi:hypothetical protein